MATNSWNSLTHMFFEQALALKEKPLLFAKNGDSWKSENWTEVAEKVTRLGAALRDMGVEKVTVS